MNASEDPEAEAETRDASRRTWLALERTQLAWWRTGLTALAVGIGIGRVVPELQHSETQWPFVLVGVAFAVYGITLIVYGAARERYLAADLERGANRLSHASFDLLLAGFGAALGIATALLIAFA
jgi:putative membrane protein